MCLEGLFLFHPKRKEMIMTDQPNKKPDMPTPSEKTGNNPTSQKSEQYSLMPKATDLPSTYRHTPSTGKSSSSHLKKTNQQRHKSTFRPAIIAGRLLSP